MTLLRNAHVGAAQLEQVGLDSCLLCCHICLKIAKSNMQYRHQNCSDLHKAFTASFTFLGFGECLMNNYWNCLLLCIYTKPLYNQKQSCPESSCGTLKSVLRPRESDVPTSRRGPHVHRQQRVRNRHFRQNHRLTKGNLCKYKCLCKKKKKRPKGMNMRRELSQPQLLSVN